MVGSEENWCFTLIHSPPRLFCLHLGKERIKMVSKRSPKLCVLQNLIHRNVFIELIVEKKKRLFKYSFVVFPTQILPSRESQEHVGKQTKQAGLILWCRVSDMQRRKCFCAQPFSMICKETDTTFSNNESAQRTVLSVLLAQMKWLGIQPWSPRSECSEVMF